jgi:tetratricopeptide (TPR) repeat protein
MAGAAVRAVQALPGERGRAAVFAGLLAEAQGHDDEAFRDYRDALDISPQIPDALARATKLLVARKRPGDALKLFDEIAAKVPGDPIPLNLKGDQLLAARDFAGAEAAYRGAVQRAPRWWLPQRGLAYVALGRGDAQAAIRALEEAAPKVDSGWRLQAAAAQLLELSNHADEAIALYDKALAGAGTDAEGLGAANNLAMLLVTHRQDAASLKRAEQLTLAFASAGNPLVLDTYGWVRYRNGDVPGALTALERAVAIDGKLPVLQYHLGVVQEAAGQPDQALTSLQLAVRSGQTFAGLQDAADRLDRLRKVSR